jgi:hypothetical protein
MRRFRRLLEWRSIVSTRRGSLSGRFRRPQIMQCVSSFSEIANSAAQTERELGARLQASPRKKP